jgi:transposase-like protein
MVNLSLYATLDMNVVEVKSLEGLVGAFQREGLEEDLIRECVEKLQEQLIHELCGGRYHPLKDGFYRAGTRWRTLKTLRGPVRFRLAVVKDEKQSKPVYPLLDYLGVTPYQRMTRDLVKACVGLSLRSTYQDASKDLLDSTGHMFSKSTLHRRVQETAGLLDDYHRDSLKKYSFVLADGTKTHGLDGKNEVNVVLGKNLKTGEKAILGLGVNKGWDQIQEQITPHQTKKCVITADSEPSIRLNLLNQNKRFQSCIRHAINKVNYDLWKMGVPAKERKNIRKELERLLYTLKNSVLKHLADQDMQALEDRIEKTRAGLKELAKHLTKEGYGKISQFIRNSGNHLLTFAYLALKGQHIPWNNNLIERVMGEVAKRCKNKWMHWSTDGLQNLLTFLLIEFTQPKTYQQFCQDYIGPPATLKFTLTINKEVTQF